MHKHSVHICNKCVRKIKNISKIASPVSIIRSAHNHAAQISHIWVDFEPDNLECTLCLRHKSLVSGFLAKRARTTHSDNANVTPHCDNTPPLLSPLCPVDLSTAEGSIYLSDKQDSVSENVNAACVSSKSPPAVGGPATPSSHTASKVQLDTLSDCSGRYSPPLHSTPNKANAIDSQTTTTFRADINLSHIIPTSLTTTVNETPIKQRSFVSSETSPAFKKDLHISDILSSSFSEPSSPTEEKLFTHLV